MTEAELPAIPEEDYGPPVLLKRLGNAVEANLAKSKLASAGIPSFLGGENVFGGDLMHPLPYREVELYVPEAMVNDALDVLDAPPLDEDEVVGEPFTDDPGRGFAFRAFVCAMVGWMVFFLDVYGFLLALGAFAYACYLAMHALRESDDRTLSIKLKCAGAVALSLAGFATSALVALEILRRA